MRAKVLTSSYTREAGYYVHRVYLEPDFDQAEKDLNLLYEVDPSGRDYKLTECDLFGNTVVTEK